MAEPVRLNCDLTVGELLRALDNSPLDTSVLACLAGRWRAGPMSEDRSERQRARTGAIDSTASEDRSERQRARTGAIDSTASEDRSERQRASTGAIESPAFIGWAPTVVRAALPESDGQWVSTVGSGGQLWSARFDQWLERRPDGSWWWTGPVATAVIVEGFLAGPAEPVRLDISSATSTDEHLAAVEAAIAAIRAGALYQVNVCARLHGNITGNPLELFTAGIEGLQPDYAAFVRTPTATAVSLSPELFLDRRDEQLRTAPIKGTLARTLDPDVLLHSRKDRAENIMIVDLMRNDLSRICRPGSVRASELLTVQPAPGVWHLVSHVTGELPAEVPLSDVLSASFPPGSVTGAPKLRALELIAELETEPRGLFTGAIGWAGPGGAEFNVAIRTFEITGDRFELGVGGGITADSVPLREWQECQLKVAPLLSLGGADRPIQPEPVPEGVDISRGIFTTMLVVDGRIVALSDHLARLEASVLEVYGHYLPDGLAARLTAAAAGSGRQAPVADLGRQRVRVTVAPGHEPRIETGPAPAAGGTIELRRGERPPGCWRHKWADRTWLTDSAHYFLNCDGGVSETGAANLVLVRPGILRTPVLDSAVLPGVTRRRFLDAALDRGWQVQAGPLGVGELLGGGLVLALSSLREVVLVDRLDGVSLDIDHELWDDVRDWLG